MTDRTRVVLEYWAPTCFLCRWILQDVLDNGKLTGQPYDHAGAPQFPVNGKLKHIELETQTLDNRTI